jgi:hypothetical protein
VLIGRFFTTGGMPMLRMMGGSPEPEPEPEPEHQGHGPDSH